MMVESKGATMKQYDSKSFPIYLKCIGERKPLSEDIERKLSTKIQKGSLAAVSKLVESNLHFVITMALKYEHFGVPIPDLVSEGNLGLVIAARKFKKRDGCKFLSHAVWYIRAHILKLLADQGRFVKIPTHRISLMSKIHKCIESHRTTPPADVIADELGVCVQDVKILLDCKDIPVPLDLQIGPDGMQSIVDTIEDVDQESPERHIYRKELKEKFKVIIEGLTPIEKEVVTMYYGFDDGIALSHKEIGAKIGRTLRQARDIKNRAVGKLRDKILNCNVLV